MLKSSEAKLTCKECLTAQAPAGFALACAASVAAAWGLIANGSDAFSAYLGPLDPRAVILACGIIGAIALKLLRRSGWIGAVTTRRQALIVAGLATCLAIPTVFVDILQPFPRDTNQPLPQALLFYPSIAFVVEVSFHLVPLAVLLGAWHLIRPEASQTRYWIAAIPVALLEPAFQIAAGLDGAPGWRDAYLGVHLFVFSMVRLAILRRGGFAGMVWFRLVYYLHWHILWGTARLHLLF